MADVSELSSIIIDAANGARATLGNPFDIDYAVQLYRSFSPEQSAGLFVGVSEFFDPDGQPSGTIQGIEYAVDDAVDLAELFAFNLQLVRPKNVVLALSGAPKKESSRAALAKLKAEGAKQHQAGFTTVLFLAQRIRNRAKADGLWVRGYISMAFVCPLEGAIDPRQTASLAGALLGLGCDEICLADTIGTADVETVASALEATLPVVPVEQLALHMHDTYGRAVDNIDIGYGAGIRVFDAAAGGLGGCPFAPGAAGNLATERLIAHLDRRGIAHGVDRELGNRDQSLRR